jgi:hypothetical protein
MPSRGSPLASNTRPLIAPFLSRNQSQRCARPSRRPLAIHLTRETVTLRDDRVRPRLEVFEDKAALGIRRDWRRLSAFGFPDRQASTDNRLARSHPDNEPFDAPGAVLRRDLQKQRQQDEESHFA